MSKLADSVTIDPGKSGAMAFFRGKELLEIIDLPDSGKRKFEHLEMYETILDLSDPDNLTVVIEAVHSSPMMGPSSAFNFGYSFASVVAVANIITNGKAVLISPQKWKGALGLWGKDKGNAVDKFKERYPEHSHYVKFKKYHDRAEAALIGIAFMILKDKGLI